MIKKNLALSMVLVLFFSGCGTANKNASKNTENKNETTMNDKNNNSTSKDSENKQKEIDKSETERKAFTPLVLSDVSSLSTKAISWSWMYSPRDNASLLSKYKGYAFGDTSKKVIYLTFDEGYENGYTSSILDTLKKNNVHAAFFVTKPFATGSFKGVPNASLLKRMKVEGHIIGNHSVHHKSMPTFKNEKAFDDEITGVESVVNSIPGCKMSKYFRPPEGTFSELSLYYTQKIGYKSIFFALAHQDYDANKQPDPGKSKAVLLKNTRNGMICLLHAMSKTNVAILDSLIKEWKNEGYEFKTLDELPN
ncbi:polysaccharide deacetylase family protein [Clostridium sp. JS66]|uniref:polysaccharide deacetylase family protein n=1 Tax=Clostridium sp. JS66 TaxID=3064705 RepID=UPI00298DEAF0|nr:polysaccharide deacetylase family protein [Clostridium sp. JS66]WPC44497.1 polysaccharide deacetylase family protein [Clostridium sp. JS66]